MKTFTILIHKYNGTYVAECLNLPVAVQSDNLNELRRLMIEGIQLHLATFPNDEENTIVEQLALEVAHV